MKMITHFYHGVCEKYFYIHHNIRRKATALCSGHLKCPGFNGMNLFEVRPERDINNVTATTGAQLIINFIGILTHSGQVDR